jgi:YbbR domain-containing protein
VTPRVAGLRPGTLLLACVMAFVIWSVAQGSSSIERGYDIPIVFQKIPEHLVLTGQSADVVNIQVRGGQAALRGFSATKLEYTVSAEGAQRGTAVYEVDTTRIELPRGAQVVSRSPAALEVTFERRDRRSVSVRPDIEGEPAAGMRVTRVEVDPANVWLAGARSDIVRLREVSTEPIDITGISETVLREVRLSVGGGHVWVEDPNPVEVQIQLEPVPAETTRPRGKK